MTAGKCSGCRVATSRREFVIGLIGLTPLLLIPIRADAATETIEYAIPSADGPSFDATNDVIVMRWQARVYAFSLACPHQNTVLRWKGESGRFQCPKHNSKYRPDGSFISGRATRSMDRFAVYRQRESVVVDLSRLYSEEKDGAAWAAASLEL